MDRERFKCLVAKEPSLREGVTLMDVPRRHQGEGQVTFTLKFAPNGDYEGEVTELIRDNLLGTRLWMPTTLGRYYGVSGGSA